MLRNCFINSHKKKCPNERVTLQDYNVYLPAALCSFYCKQCFKKTYFLFFSVFNKLFSHMIQGHTQVCIHILNSVFLVHVPDTTVEKKSKHL